MKCIIAGSRYANAKKSISSVDESVKTSGFKITLVVSGACGLRLDDPDRDEKPAKGIDGAGELWAMENQIPLKRFYADWTQFGKSAGPKRNEQMGNFGEGLIAHPGASGTQGMVEIAKKKGLELYIVKRLLDNGFGSQWETCERADCDLQIASVGKVQCGNPKCGAK